MNVIVLAYLGMSVVLAVSGLVIVYPAVAGVQVVVYRRAVLFLGASILLFVLSWLVVFLFVYGYMDRYTVTVVSLAGNTVAGTLHLAAVWLFARDFIEFGRDAMDVQIDSSETGGFADERE